MKEFVLDLLILLSIYLELHVSKNREEDYIEHVTFYDSLILFQA